MAGARPLIAAKAGTPPFLPTRLAAADDLRAAIGLWLAWLAGERRASPHTVAAYGRDLDFFLDFLKDHLGGLPSLAAIDRLRPADFRAYLARRAGDGLGRSSRARLLSVLRGFVRFLQRRGLASTTALVLARPLGLLVQRYITTRTPGETMSIRGVKRLMFLGSPAHFVTTDNPGARLLPASLVS